MMRSLSFTVSEKYDGAKVYTFLKCEVKISLRLLRTLKRIDRGIELNGEHIRTVDPVHTGDILTLNIPGEEGARATSGIEIDVVYEDEDILVVNKPAMLPIHESHNHQGDTLANAVSAHLQKEGKSSVFRAVGRLDKGTSGLVVCALNQHSAARLSGKIDKTYLAVPSGEYKENGTIDEPIYRPDPMKTLRCVDVRGDRAVTHYEVLSHSSGMSLLRVRLETGRTHQIRVHFAHLGTPLVGDRLYGGECDEIERQCLHCANAEFEHPVTGERIECNAPLPKDMQRIIESAGLKCN